MAKKKRNDTVASGIGWTPPTPKQIADAQIKEAARAATMADPRVQRLQKRLEADMRKAAHDVDFEQSDGGGKEW